MARHNAFVRTNRRARRALSLAGLYDLASLAVLLVTMLILGWWVGRQIEAGVVHQTAAASALYVENFVVAQLQELGSRRSLDASHVRTLERLLAEAPLGREVVSIKIWGPGGRVVFGSDAGEAFEVKDELRRAWNGEVVSHVSNLRDPENAALKARWGRLLETYTPLRVEGSDRVIAVAEFYRTVTDLERDVRAAQARSWGVVAAVMLATYLLLSGLVRRGSDTIARQQRELGAQVEKLGALLAQNAALSARVRRAATRVTELNEHVLGRVSAELHDGPAQDLGYALLRLDALSGHVNALPPERRAVAESDLARIQSSLASAMREIRELAADVRLPDLHGLMLAEVLERAARDHTRRTDTPVETRWGSLPIGAPLPVKITAFRIVREALTNAFKHAGGRGQKVEADVRDAALVLTISDEGGGFDEAATDKAGHFGLAGMRERAEALGGSFEVERTQVGTRVQVRLPLGVVEDG